MKTKKSVESKTIDLTQEVGEIITWKIKGSHSFIDVKNSLSSNNLDPQLCLDISHRVAFTRATKKLVKDQVIDVVESKEGEVVFQFTGRTQDESTKDWEYRKLINITLNTDNGKVTCSDQALEASAQAAIWNAIEERTASDVSRIIQKYCESETDLIPLREEGGVYMLLGQNHNFLNHLQGFAETLGGRLNRIKMMGGRETTKSVQLSLIDYISGMVEDHYTKIDQFGDETRFRTMQDQAEEINMTRAKLETYAIYLEDRKEELSKKIKDCDAVLQDRITEVSNGLRSYRVQAELIEWAGEKSTKVIQWMAHQGWSLDTIRKIIRNEMEKEELINDVLIVSIVDKVSTGKLPAIEINSHLTAALNAIATEYTKA